MLYVKDGDFIDVIKVPNSLLLSLSKGRSIIQGGPNLIRWKLLKGSEIGKMANV